MDSESAHALSRESSVKRPVYPLPSGVKRCGIQRALELLTNGEVVEDVAVVRRHELRFQRFFTHDGLHPWRIHHDKYE